MTQVKICGLRHPEPLESAVKAGADFIGLVFYPPSPRAVDVQEAAALCQVIGGRARCVGVFVDPTDALLDHVLGAMPLDMVQLHGQESPDRCAAIKERRGISVIKAISVAAAADLSSLHLYEPVCDMLLFDTKPIDTDTQPGGTGRVFDWTVLQDQQFARPWILSGGLNAYNVADALSRLDPAVVDVSSGVESAPGQKDIAQVKNFIHKVKSCT